MEEKIVTEEILGNIIARFMQERKLEKMALMIKMNKNNTINVDMLAGQENFKINKGE